MGNLVLLPIALIGIGIAIISAIRYLIVQRREIKNGTYQKTMSKEVTNMVLMGVVILVVSYIIIINFSK